MKILVPVVSYLLVFNVGGAAAFWCWRGKRKHLLPLPRLRWGRWTGGEIVLAVLTIHMLSLFVMSVLRESSFLRLFYDMEPGYFIESLWARPLALPLALAGIFFTLYYLSGTYPNDVGLSTARWRANIVLGYAGFVVATPMILGVNALLSLLPDTKAHDFVEQGKNISSPVEWGLLLFLVSVFAPITEELLFRGLLQGWLRRASLLGHLIVVAFIWAIGMSLAMPAPPGKEAPPEEFWNELRTSLAGTNWSRVIFTTLLVMTYLVALQWLKKRNMFLTEADFLPVKDPEGEEDVDENDAPRKATPAEAEAQARWQAHDKGQQRAKSGLAIFGSAMCFALVHPPWPDPIALFLLGLVLGWLAHRTQNLLPGMALHALFNAVAWVTLLLSQYVPDQDTNGNAATTALRPSLAGSIVNSSPGSWLPRLK